ncbi:MAG TPA: SpoIIE family protein phosphatase, partial [Thermoanaerobaculia bacterium]|nr:SpoIIE family protein phosphatase [Thermoanaerobaculia bacterium]
MNPKSSRRALAAAIVAAAIVATFVVAAARIPYLSTLATVLLAGAVILLLLWLAGRLLRRFLWKVGRRLAFSYFLSGMLPIPLVALLLLVGAYLLAGFFMGHLYRDAARSLQNEVALLADARAREFARTGKPSGDSVPGLVFGYYRNGRRVGGDPRTPAAWPTSLVTGGGGPAPQRREVIAPFLAREDGSPSLAAAAVADASRGTGVVALYVASLEAALSERSDVWVEMVRPDEAEAGRVVRIEMGTRNIPLTRIHRERATGEAEKFFKRRSEGARLWDKPFLWWGEASGQLVRLDHEQALTQPLDITLRSTPRGLLRHLFSSSAEVDTGAWAALFTLAFLLFDIYLAATAMALFMIFSLSRAVNQMSRATAAVQGGDFSVRIPARRKDQVGSLQRSFNQMAANLETLVATSAQKEVLEKELAIARDLQKSLIPGDLPSGDAVEFATLFEPSAAIGGDYFDILRLDDRRLAVIIADVSGHGLSTGLRMAMIKAALLILVQEATDPEEILRRLDSVVRSDAESRFFVTATLSLVDFTNGSLEITNAGHPPTYLLRDGQVEEIVLPGSPLGGMGRTYGRRTLRLEKGDLVVWLSDGLIEATDAAGEPFGYDAVVAALAGAAGRPASPMEVRNRLLAAVERHAGG